MTTTANNDWNPGTYARFRGLRLRPARDLIHAIDTIPAGPVVDLGCGAGTVGPVLAARFGDRSLIGVDTSPAMLAEAAKVGIYDHLTRADIAGWTPEGRAARPALIFSNAVLHWLDDHESLLPRLARLLPPGGVLAVQMPGQFHAPSHRLLREIAATLFPDRFGAIATGSPVSGPDDYARLLAPFGQVQAWETTYSQRLDAGSDAHPVRRFTESTAMRPFLGPLSEGEADQFIAAYEAELARAYPREDDGSVLFAFRRVFFTLERA
ncbi:methyltransferase domain-containing protein [Maritimibacter sp. HL-12]|uniref:methyltransferase domain-containing protein n=1 Tax=Maritimibacter sp. HL-12 TaxID=1162418 RepID=UPI000A0F2736|nr:methyltransferase domain-containing protein [Maritimibacter sp. HL-12]SMH34577.1 trans-aconitate 2-methyltransferase [Maritimibacter sp. HL-12]